MHWARIVGAGRRRLPWPVSSATLAGLLGPADLPGALDVALDLAYPIPSEIFDERTHVIPP
jgi:hypothetical protein